MVKNIKSFNEAKKLVDLALYTGQLLIISGAEIYRAEDTVKRICEATPNIDSVNAYALPSALFISIEFQGESYTKFKRVEPLRTNLSSIDKLNTFSRKFVSSKEHISYEDAFLELSSIEKENSMAPWKVNLSGAMAGAFFTLLFGGDFRDFFCTFFITAFMSYVLNKISNLKFTFMLDNFIGAFIVSILAVVSIKLNIGSNIDKIIIGAIMVLVPGVAATNASRDIMNGDFLSGVIGFTKAMFLALSIALGVGVVLKVFI